MNVRALVQAAGRRHLTVRAALLLAAPAPVLPLLGAPWGSLVAGAWLLACAALIERDARAARYPETLRWERSFGPKLSIGAPNRVLLHITNPTPDTIRIEGRDTPPPGFAGERRFGPVVVAPGERLDVPFSYVPASRGSFTFGAPGVRTIGPLGLAGITGRPDLAQGVKVYPDIRAVRAFALLARKGALAEMGVKRMRLAGEGTEFESLRDYVQGDGFRDIDWKATARRGRPIVREFEMERSQTTVIALDTGRLMTPDAGGVSRLDRAVDAALLLAYLGIRRDDLVGLMVFGRDVERYLPPRKGHRQFLAILEALHAVVGKVEEPDYARAMRTLAARLPKRALVVVFTDLQGSEPSRRLVTTLSAMAPRHLPLVVTQRDRAIEQRARTDARDEQDVFEAGVAEALLADKAAALRLLQSRGVLALDVHPEELSVASVNRYLEVKARGRL